MKRAPGARARAFYITEAFMPRRSLSLVALSAIVLASFTFGAALADARSVPVAQYEPRAPYPSPAPPPPPGNSATATAPPRPAENPAPPGEREPLVGILAVVAILVAGGAGIWIYRVIRKGL